MAKIKKFHRIILIFLLMNALITEIFANTKEYTYIQKKAKQFLYYLKRWRIKSLRKLLLSEVKIFPLEEEQLTKLNDELITNDSFYFNYITQITGNNLYKLLFGYKNGTARIKFKVKSYKFVNIDTSTKVLPHGYKDEFYVVKFLPKMEKQYYKTKKSRKPYKKELLTKDIEVYVMPMNNNRYKIFGFII